MICYIIIGSFDPFASNWEVLILSSQLMLLLMHGMVHAVLFAGLPPETLSVALLTVECHSQLLIESRFSSLGVVVFAMRLVPSITL